MKCLILELGMALLIILVRYICFVKKKKKKIACSFFWFTRYNLSLYPYLARLIAANVWILFTRNRCLWCNPAPFFKQHPLKGPKWYRNLGDISKNVSPVQTYVVQDDTRSTNPACSFKIGSKTRMECIKPLLFSTP